MSPRRIIALHGWLDNAASFDFIAPHILNADIIALDLSGHGNSSHRSYLGAYNIWQDVIEILAVANQMQWQTFSVLGHSRGAVIAALLAGCFPERIEASVLLEWVLPEIKEELNFPSQLAQSISTSFMLHSRPRNYYKSKEAAILARVNGKFPVSMASASAFAERGIHHDGKGYYWCSDPKLLAPPEIKLTPLHAQECVAAFTHQSLVILGDKGLLAPRLSQLPWLRDNTNLRIETISGDHHLHMSSDIRNLSQQLKLINDYFS